MTYQVLARKWRPRRFDDLVGQSHVARALKNALDSGRLHHAYLFTGTRGVGKTTIARIFAKAVNCERGVSSSPCGECSACVEVDAGHFVDLIEVDAASRTRVDETRELMDDVQYLPTRGRFKVYLIDEVQMFSNHSFNALLKTLEEPPAHVKFLLATTDPKRLPVTVLSRCLQLNLTRLPVSDLQAHLDRILDAEGVAHDTGSVRAIAAMADGSVRDALSLLDQAIAYGGGTLKEDEVAAMLGTVSGAEVGALVEALAARDGVRLMQVARGLVDANPDFLHVLGELLSYLRRIAVYQVLGTEGDAVEDDEAIKSLARRISAEDCQLYYQIGVIGRRDLPLAPDPQIGFEMVLLRMLAFTPAQVRGAAAPAPEDAPTASAAPATASQAPSASPVTAPSAEEWPELIEELRLTGLVRELALNCAFVEYRDRVLSLSVAPQFERLHNKKSEQRLQEALRGRYGAGLRLRIQASAEALHSSPSAQSAAQERARQRQAELLIESDDTVRALRETFGARVEDVSIR